MDLSEMQTRAAELEQQISALPAGSITKKTVSGKDYFYHRWTENKKRREKYIPADELENFRAQIERRKALEQELKALKKQLPKAKSANLSAFTTNVRTGEALRSFAASVRGYRRRECFRQLHDFVCGEPQDKVFILYGLRRTGKTTMIRQIFAEMNDAELAKAAFIQITAKDTLADVNRDLKALEAQGFRYVFLDEVTLMEDFIEGAALFSDVFAACGMKIVLSGKDSLGFLFTEDEQLYDRCILLHTTFIPYREFESVLGIHGIDEYIRYGGTMSLGGVHYNETSTFASKESTDEYVDTAIARNIQHSLRCYQYEGHFRHLRDLYEKGELTSAINRVVEDINHRFTLEVLSQDWKSHDLGISASNLRRDRKNPTDILDRIDLALVTDSLRKLLEIRNKEEQTVKLDDVHAAEIKEYLDLLDLTREIDVLHLPDVSTKSSRTVIAQPGLRYAQADALIRSLPSSFAETMAMQLAQAPGAKPYEEWLAQLNASYGLDLDIVPGFFTWLSKAVVGNFGDSWKWNVPATQKFTEVIGLSVIMGGISFVLSIVIAVPLGVLAATKQYSRADYVITSVALVGISLPTFFFATLLKLFFSVKLGWFDLYGLVGRDYAQLDSMGQFLDKANHLVLPIVTLVIVSIGGYMRYTRTNMLEVLNADYIRTARAKGLSERTVIYKHAFRNTLIPLVTIIGGSLPGLFSGALITETLFSIPGIGYVSYQSMVAGDIPFTMFYLSFMAVLTLASNLLTDILYGVVDPRVRIS